MLSQRVRSLGVALAAIGGIWLLASTTGHSPLDASGETWTPGPDMLVRQYDATSVMLQDGRVLVIGGKNDAGFLDASETYDSVTGQWRLTSTMRAPRARATATVLSDGRVLVAGGVTGDSGPALASAEIFDPVNDQWMTVAPMRVPRTGHTATRLQDGRVLVVAGFTGANSTSSHYVSAEIYEPALDMWVAVQNIRTRREGHSATLLNDGRVLIAGGGNYSAYLRSAEIFNPATGVWTEVAPMGDLRYEHVAAALPDGSPLVMGGVGWPNYLATVEAYDPQANQWRRLASMNSRRWRARGATLGDGRVIVVGGLSDASGSPTAVRNAEVYDPTLGTWTLTPSLATARVKSILAVLPRDEVLVASGHDGQYLLSTEILRRPVTDVTPPVITSSVSGTLGANGWYISDVRVTWTVVDPESPVTSTSGCGNFILGTDSRGLTLVCEATSGGGINSGSVAIRRDVSAPAIDLVSPTGSPTVVLGQTLTANYSCLDLVAGVAGCAGPVPSSASADTTTLGLHNFAVTATDAAGNTSTASTAYTVIKDATTPYLYVTNHDQAQIQIVDPVTARVIGTIPGVTARPYGIAITPDRRKAYVANAQGTDVIVVDLVSDQVLTRVRVGDYQPSNPQRVAISPDGRQAWVTCFWDNSVVVIDTATDTVMNRFATGSGATGVAIHPAGTAVYVTNAVGDSLSTIDVATGTVTTVAVGDAPQEVVVSPDGQQVYVALQFEGAIGVVDTAQQTVTRIAVGSNVVSLALAPDGRRLYAARDEPGGTLLAIDTATRQIVWAIPFGIYPVGIAVSDDGRYVAANGNGTGVTVLIDPVTLARRTVSVPTSAIGLAFLPTPRASTIITPDPVSVAYGGGPVTLRARLMSPAGPLAGRTVRFDLENDGTWDYFAATDSNGLASYVVGQLRIRTSVGGPGAYAYRAGYDGELTLAAAAASAPLVITKGVPRITLAGGSFIYDGSPHPATAVVATGGFDEVLAPVTVTYDPGPSAPIRPGSYVVTATFPGDDNYLALSRSDAINIERATPVIAVEGGSVRYTGSPQLVTATVTGLGGEVLSPVEVVYAPGGTTSPVAVGEYAVTVRYAGGPLYQPVSATTTLVVLPAFPTISIVADPVTYDGQPHPATATTFGVFGEELGPILISYRKIDLKGVAPEPGRTLAGPVAQTKDGKEPQTAGAPTAEQEWTTTPPVSAGIYDVRAQFLGGGNYDGAQSQIEFQILRATPVVSVSGGTFTYDGQPHGALSVVIGVLGEELGEALVDYDPSGQPPVDAGVYIASGTYAGSANYGPATGEAQIRIVPASPAIVVMGGSFVYDGQPHAATATAVGVLGEDLGVVPIDYQPGGEPPLNGGVYTATATFAGNINYERADGTATITIERAGPTVAATGGTFGYDGRPHAATASATGVRGEPLAAPVLEYTPGGGVPSQAGTYEVLARFAGDRNYTSAEGRTTVTIEPGAPNVVVSGGSYPYDGTAHLAIGSATGVDGESLGPLSFTYNGNAAAPLAAGTYDVIGTFPGNGNYNRATASTVIQITATALRIGLMPGSKTYGQPNPPLQPTFEGFVASEGPTNLSGSLEIETAATSSSGVGTYPATPGGLTSTNYLITFVPSTLAVLQGASVTRLTSSSNPAGYQQTIALRADVTPTPAGDGSATGTVEFFAGTTLLGSATVSGGAATINVVLESGSHEIAGQYLGDNNLTASAASLTQTVNPRNASSTTTLRVRPSQSQVGDAVTFDIDVSSPAGTLANSVLLTDGAGTIFTVQLVGGRATYTTSLLTVGSHAFVARYAGNETTTASVSPPVIHTVVDGAPLERTTIRLSPRSVKAGVDVPVDVIVSATGAAPTGTVTLYLDGQHKGELVLVQTAARESMAATILPKLTAGTHILMAVYTGSDVHAGSTSEVQLRVK